jgi:hypothetical protein
MSSRIAVLLCGDIRTWNQAAEYVFNYVEYQSKSVDYYFVTWSTTSDYWYNEEIRTTTTKSVTVDDVVNKFNGRNLINYKILDINTVPNHRLTYYYRAHLAKLANILKRRHELDNNFVYDQVFELRPDLYIPKPDNTPIDCGDFEYVTAPIYSHLCELHSMPDLYLRSNSFTNDIIADRINYSILAQVKKFQNLKGSSGEYEPMPSTRDPHWLLLSFLYSRRLIQLDSTEGVYATALRPTFPDNLYELTIEEIRDLSKKYINFLTGH